MRVRDLVLNEVETEKWVSDLRNGGRSNNIIRLYRGRATALVSIQMLGNFTDDDGEGSRNNSP